MGRQKSIESYISYEETTPESYEGSKKWLLENDEVGQMELDIDNNKEVKIPMPFEEKHRFYHKYIEIDFVQYIFRLGKLSLVILKGNSMGWFRLFGKGIAWKDTTIHSLLFSERNGHSKYVKIGKWAVSWLK